MGSEPRLYFTCNSFFNPILHIKWKKNFSKTIKFKIVAVSVGESGNRRKVVPVSWAEKNVSAIKSL